MTVYRIVNITNKESHSEFNTTELCSIFYLEVLLHILWCLSCTLFRYSFNVFMLKVVRITGKLVYIHYVWLKRILNLCTYTLFKIVRVTCKYYKLLRPYKSYMFSSILIIIFQALRLHALLHLSINLNQIIHHFKRVHPYVPSQSGPSLATFSHQNALRLLFYIHSSHLKHSHWGLIVQIM